MSFNSHTILAKTQFRQTAAVFLSYRNPKNAVMVAWSYVNDSVLKRSAAGLDEDEGCGGRIADRPFIEWSTGDGGSA